MIGDTINIRTIILLLVIPSAIGILFNLFSETGISFIRAEETFIYEDNSNIAAIIASENTSIEEMKIISLDQAFKLYSANKATFIDARDKWDFAEGHILNAVNIPEYNFDPKSEKILSLPKDILYVIYCNDDDCETSQRLATELAQLSFTKIYIFEEGWNSWLNANYPTDKSELE